MLVVVLNERVLLGFLCGIRDCLAGEQGDNDDLFIRVLCQEFTTHTQLY